MEDSFYYLLSHGSIFTLLIVIGITLFTLSKGADILVDEAVSLSVHWGVPKTIIGATIVSLGTTLPEVSVSVLAALHGNSDLALGNAVGSIIVDTGLILGIASVIGNLPVDKNIIDRQGKVQIAAAVLLTFLSLPIFFNGIDGNIPQWVGLVFILLLSLYIFISVKWAKSDGSIDNSVYREERKPIVIQLIKLISGIIIVIVSSKILIPAVEITAGRIGIPQSVIAATLVAFGTSLPELITAVTAVRKGHGELAVGNIIGADILNVLFVVGSAAAVTHQGLTVPHNYYYLQFPAMLLILFLFRFFAKNSNGKNINKKEGLWLIIIYFTYLILNYM